MAKAAEPGPVGATKAAAGTDTRHVVISIFDHPRYNGGGQAVVEMITGRLAAHFQVTVVTTESKFTPNKLTFRRGIPYRLHVENRGKELHEFNAADFFKSAKINNPTVLNADKTELVLHPKDAKDLYFIPKQAGHFRLYCPDHDWAGMTGEITVE